MKGIEVLVYEHKNVIRLTNIIRKMMVGVIENPQTLSIEDNFIIIDTIKNYTDAHHHGKEEKILFKYMLEELGEVAEKVVRTGMLIEHDLSRATVQKWSTALKNYETDPSTENLLPIIGNAYKYADLLTDHIYKEDNVVYTFAERELKQETIDLIERESEEFEIAAEEEGIQRKYLKIIEDLEQKYLV